MDRLTNVVAGLRSLFCSRRIESELDEELESFIEASTAEKISRGVQAGEAARAARVEMASSNAVKHRIRAAGWEAGFESFWKDVRYGVRRLWRSPGFTIFAVLAVTIGIGANTAIFSIVEAVLLRSLPFPEPQRLVHLTADMAGTGIRDIGFSLPEPLRWARATFGCWGLDQFWAVFSLRKTAFPGCRKTR